MGNKVKKYRLYMIIAVFILIIAAIFITIFLNSYSMVLLRNGFNTDENNIIWMGIDDNGREYRVLRNGIDGQNIKLVLVTRKFAGLWEVSQIADIPSDETIVTLGWMKVAGIKRFKVGDDSTIEFEVHVVYCGNNAKKQILTLSDQLPPNVTVNIQQAGASYMLHFISYGEADTLSHINIWELLKTSDYIE